MSFLIEDGGGTGKKAKVVFDNRLSTHAITEDVATHANENGDAYNINTKNITLTDDADTPVLYFKNNENREIIITALAFGVKTSTGGSSSDLPEVTVVRNPTGGTIISSTPTDLSIRSNRNYGSTNSINDSLGYVGATGDTMTGGEDHLFIYLGASGRSFISIAEILPSGSSIGVKIKPQANNTSQVLYCALICHLHEEE